MAVCGRKRKRQWVDMIKYCDSPMDKLTDIMVKLHDKNPLKWPLTYRFWQIILSPLNNFRYEFIDENVDDEDKDALNLFCWSTNLNSILVEKMVQLAFEKNIA